jgi:hypothetical protein
MLAISAITSSSLDFVVPGVSAYPLLVAVGASIDVVIRFQPTSAGAKSAIITIGSNDAASPHTLSVSGTAVTPRLDVAIADTGDFGPVCVGSFVDRPLVLGNGGQCKLSISNITSSSPSFEQIRRQPPSGPNLSGRSSPSLRPSLRTRLPQN